MLTNKLLCGKKRPARIALAATMGVGALLGGATARTASADTWVWAAGDGGWNTAGDWSPAFVPTASAGSDLLFSGGGYTATQDIGSTTFTLSSLRFTNSSAVTLAGASPTNSVTFVPGYGLDPTLSDTDGGDVTLSAPVVWAGNASITNSGGGALSFAGNQTFTNGTKATFTNSGAGKITLGAVTYTNSGSGAGMVITLINNNAASQSFLIAGMGALSNTTFNVGGTGTVRAATTGLDLFSGTSVLNVQQGATFDFNGNTEAMGTLTGAGTLIGNAGVSLGGSGYYDFSGAVNLGSGGFTVASASLTQRLSGNSNSYTGATLISAGTLVIGANAPANAAGALGIATSEVLVGNTTGTLNATLIADADAVSIGRNIRIQTGNTGTATVGGINATGTVTYGGNLTLGTDAKAAKGVTLTAAGGGTVVFAGNLLRSPTATAGTTDTLTKTGAGTVTLQGADTFTGATTISAGTLRLDYATLNNAAKLSPTAALTFLGGSLDLVGNGSAPTSETVKGLVLGSATSGGGGRITVTSGNGQSATLALGTITRNTGATVDFNATGTGNGTAAVTTTAANASTILGGYATYNGADWAVVGAGQITALADSGYQSAFGSGNNTSIANANAVIPSGGSTPNSLRLNATTAVTFDPATPGTLTLQSGGILVASGVSGATSIGSVATPGTIATTGNELIVQQFDTAGALTINSVIGGTNVTKSGGGTLILAGSNTYTGATYVNGGTLQVTATANLGAPSAPITINGGTLSLQTGTLGTVNSTGHKITVGAAGATFNFAVAQSFEGGGLTGTGPITKTGAGAWSVGANSSSFSGTITVSAGTLSMTSWQFASVPALTVADGATFTINDDGTGTWALANSGRFTFAGSGVSGNGAFRMTDQTQGTAGVGHDPASTIPNEVVLQSAATRFQIENGSAVGSLSSLTLAGNVTGTGGLTKSGSGLIVLTARDNAYAGGTVIENGTLRIDQGNDRLPTGTSVVLGASTNTSGVLDVNGFGQTVAGLTTAGTGKLNGVINSSATAGTLAINYNGVSSQTFAGVLGGGVPGGILNVTLAGTGTTILSGSNTYGGATNVNAGTLVAGSAHAFGDSAAAVTVKSGATVDLAGTNLAAGKTFVLSGGALISSTGTTTLSTGASATLLSGGAYAAGSSPTITVSGGGSGAGATIPLSLQLASVTVSAGSAGYSTSATATFPAAPTNGVQATAGLLFGLTQLSITSVAGGTGWALNDIVSINGGTTAALATVSGVSGGAITGLNLTSSGSGYIAAPATVTKVTSASGSATGVAITGSAAKFTITGVVVANPGYGYVTTPAVTISGPGTGGTQATATANWAIDALTFTSGGTGYTSAPSVTFNGGTPATATGGFASISLTADSSIGGNGNLVINPVISSTGTYGITKIGSGTTTLAASNTYTGATVVKAGTLLANAASATGAGTVSVTNGGVLAGTGSVGAVNVNAGGAISAGAGTTGAPGLLATAANTWAGGSTPATAGAYDWKLNTLHSGASGASGNTADTGTNGAGSNWDVLSMTTLNVLGTSAAPFNVVAVPVNQNLLVNGTGPAFNSALGSYQWVIADVTTGNIFVNGANINTASQGNPINGATNPLDALRSAFNLDTSALAAASAGTSSIGLVADGLGGEDVVINYTATPEPSSLLLSGLAAGTCLRRRRRCR